LAWCEQVCNTRVHAETHETPIARFLAGGDPTFPDPQRLTEAFFWALTRKVSSTATVSLLGNRYQVDASLVGAQVECRFLPEDLTAVFVYHEGKAVGMAVPFAISTHVHPQARPAVTTGPPTGIDYLGLVLAASEDAAPGAISYQSLAIPGEGATDWDATGTDDDHEAGEQR
jgi:putative transposase